MRTIHAELATAQAINATPYVHLEINNWDLTTRILALEHTEEAYRETAVIRLDNHDRALDPSQTGADFRGCEFTIGYGYVCPAGNRYLGDGQGSEAMANLYVKYQTITSVEGQVVCDLYCEGMWNKLREMGYIPVGSEPYFNGTFGGLDTIADLIASLLLVAGYTLSATYTSDLIIDYHYPWLTYDYRSLPSLASLIQPLIEMTLSYLRAVAGDTFEIVYPQSTDAVNETYYSYQSPYFKEYSEKRNLLLPNSIVVYWGANSATGEWDGEPYLTNLATPGTAEDAGSIAAYTTVKQIYYEPYNTTLAEANSRAAAILARGKSDSLAGRCVLPYHDCSVELYDKIRIYDTRGL
jgi:hypothetical protein